MQEGKIPVIVVAGPTASGKTALAVSLAQKFGGEVISADSMQIYDGMDIATAKPSAAELCGVPHYMLGFLPPSCEYSAADYTCLASKIAAHIHRRGRVCILCGGTGLYIDSLVGGVRFFPQGADEEYRRELRGIAEQKGRAYLHTLLAERDAAAASSINENNVVRVIRALELLKAGGGRTLAELMEQSRSEPSPYAPFYIGLTAHDRSYLYDRINARTDKMLCDGLVGEAEFFLGRGMSKTAAGAIGYKELAPYFAGEASLDECAENIKMNTRRYAKRQLTWFRRNADMHWIDIQDKSAAQISDEAERLLKSENFFGRSL